MASSMKIGPFQPVGGGVSVFGSDILNARLSGKVEPTHFVGFRFEIQPPKSTTWLGNLRSGNRLLHLCLTKAVNPKTWGFVMVNFLAPLEPRFHVSTQIRLRFSAGR